MIDEKFKDGMVDANKSMYAEWQINPCHSVIFIVMVSAALFLFAEPFTRRILFGPLHFRYKPLSEIRIGAEYIVGISNRRYDKSANRRLVLRLGRNAYMVMSSGI